MSKLNTTNSTISQDCSIAKLILINKYEKKHSKSTPKLPKPAKLEETNPFDLLIAPNPIKLFPTNSDGEEASNTIYREHLRQTFMSLKAIKNLKKPPSEKIQQKSVELTRLPGLEGRKSLIFDLDETLVHCVGAHQGEINLPIRFPSGRVCMAGVNIRPYAIDCLSAASKIFEVIVFTASHKCYADVILDYIDPSKSIIHHRLYRESCIQVNNLNIKDLRIINRRPQDIAIVDNSAFSYAFHIDNGIPIISWYSDPYDKELKDLIQYFELIAEVEDVRELNRLMFRLDTFYEDYQEEFEPHV